MSLNTVFAAAIVTLPLALFDPAQAGEANGPGTDASNYGSWTFVQVQSASANAGSEAYVSNDRFTEMAPDAVVADVGSEHPVLAGKALSVDSMTARGNVAYARHARQAAARLNLCIHYPRHGGAGTTLARRFGRDSSARRDDDSRWSSTSTPPVMNCSRW